MNGHELVANTLKSLGITHVYGLSGGPIRLTLPACSRAGIRAIGVRHQQAAVLMAAGQNYRTGRLTAVAMVSSGPAVTNCVTGTLVAWDNCWPLLVISGTFPFAHSRTNRRGMFHALDGVHLFQRMTKWSVEVPSTSQISEYLTLGFQTATSGQPGPVYLEIPENILKEKASWTIEPVSQPLGPNPCAPSQIAHASKVLFNAQRPAVIIGKGLRWTEPFEELRSLIETYHIPFITSPMGRGFLPDDHSLCFNAVRDRLQQEADVLIVLGARLNWTFRFGMQFSRDAKVIHIDIAQEELTYKRAGSIAIKGNVKQVLQELLAYVSKQEHEPRGANEREIWLERLKKNRQSHILGLEKKVNNSDLPMSPHRLMKEIGSFLPRNAVCVLDGRDTMAAAQEILPAFEPACRFTAGSNGCMGVGIPFAIGAKVSTPNCLVIVVTGDMAFGISAMEMETAVRHNIPIIVIIVNNDGGCATSVHRNLYPRDHEPVAMFQPRLPYEKIMEACGGYAESIDRPEQVQPALDRAVASGVPACLNVYVDPQAPFENYLG